MSRPSRHRLQWLRQSRDHFDRDREHELFKAETLGTWNVEKPVFREGEWWACVGPRGIPVIFGSEREAHENCDRDERVCRVSVAELPEPEGKCSPENWP